MSDKTPYNYEFGIFNPTDIPANERRSIYLYPREYLPNELKTPASIFSYNIYTTKKIAQKIYDIFHTLPKSPKLYRKNGECPIEHFLGKTRGLYYPIYAIENVKCETIWYMTHFIPKEVIFTLREMVDIPEHTDICLRYVANVRYRIIRLAKKYRLRKILRQTPLSDDCILLISKYLYPKSLRDFN